MSVLSPLDNQIVAEIYAAAGQPQRLEDILSSLIAGAGLAIALAADADPRRANELCERGSIGLFREATSQAVTASMLRRRL